MGAGQAAEIRDLLSQGRSTGEIVDLLGVSPGSVAAVRANITRGTYSARPRRGGVMYLRSGGELVEMAEQAYDSEDALQTLLASHPGLLAGDEVSATSRGNGSCSHGKSA